MNNNSMKVVATNLSQLKATFGKLKLEVPKLDEALSKDPARHDEAVRVIRAGISQIDEGVSNALKYIATAQDWVKRYEDRIERKIAHREVAEDIRGAQEYISECLAHSESFYKAAAARAYLLHVLSLTYENQQEAMAMLADLKERQLLIEDNNGQIMIGYQHYQIGNVFDLDDEDKAEVTQTVAKFSRTFMQLVKQQRQKKSEDMELSANITPDQLKEGVLGVCKLVVPAETYLDRNNIEQWRGGGEILVELKQGSKDAKLISPLEGNGSLEKEVASMKKMGVNLLHSYAFGRDVPPGYGREAFNRVLEAVKRNRGLNNEGAERFVKKTQMLWHLIHRAFCALKNQKEMKELEAAFRKSTDITPKQFFGLGCQRQQGTACLKFEGAFNQPGKPSVYNLFFLVTRSEVNAEASITIIDAPKHVAQFFNSLMNKPFKEGGDDFRGLPAPLSRIFRAIRSQLDMAAEIAKE